MAVWFMRWLQGVLCEQSPPFDLRIASFAASTRAPSINGRDDAFRAHALTRFHLLSRNHLEGDPRRHQIDRSPHHRERRNAWL